MYISELRLHNFKSFENSAISFSKNINIITGKNNSGKSSIIRSIYQIQSRNAISFDDVRKPLTEGNITLKIDEINQADLVTFKDSGEKSQNKLLNDSITIITTIRTSPVHTNIFSNFSPSELVENINREGLIRSKGESENNYGKIQFNGLTDSEAENNFIYPFLTRRKTNVYGASLDYKNIHVVQDDFRFILA